MFSGLKGGKEWAEQVTAINVCGIMKDRKKRVTLGRPEDTI